MGQPLENATPENWTPANLTPAQAQELLAKAQAIRVASGTSAAWPVAMIFTSLAIIGSMLMIGLHIVGHSGYGGPVLAFSATVRAIFTASIWPIFQRSTKTGYSRRFLTSLFGYFAVYTAALIIGAVYFRDGNFWFYIPAAVVLAVVGLAAAFRELRA